MRKRRQLGQKINFGSLEYAPTNELGVVYLFGVLHEAFGLKIQSIQSGFPDCIAHRKTRRDRWEEVRIEFEYESKTFLLHRHNPDDIDVIVCWKHNWPECPPHIEIIELATQLSNMGAIARDVRDKKKLSAYNLFCRQKKLEGLSFAEIADLWRKQKRRGRPSGRPV